MMLLMKFLTMFVYDVGDVVDEDVDDVADEVVGHVKITLKGSPVLLTVGVAYAQ